MSTKMFHIILALGSNVGQERHITAAQQLLEERIIGMRFTRSIWTEPIDTVSDKPYLNCIGDGETSLTFRKLTEVITEIENVLGRERTPSHHQQVTIDIDILLYNGKHYHEKDWERPYIQKLLKDIAYEEK